MQVTLREMEITGGLFQIVMPQQNLDGVQVGTGLQQVRGEAVTEHVGINLLLKAGAAGGVLTGVAGRFGVDGLIAGVPGVTGEEPNRFLAQLSPVRAEFPEQNGTEHHVAVFAPLAALDVNYPTLAIDIADL